MRISVFTDTFYSSEAKSPKQTSTGPWHGPVEKYKKEVSLLTLVTDERGLPVAVLAGDQILPFDVIRVSKDGVKRYNEQYQRHDQGQLYQVLGDRPKR